MACLMHCYVFNQCHLLGSYVDMQLSLISLLSQYPCQLIGFLVNCGVYIPLPHKICVDKDLSHVPVWFAWHASVLGPP